jgi:hypothetical protein
MHAWPPADVSPSDWMAVTVMCLAPLRRAVLDELAGSPIPLRPRDLSHLGCDDAVAKSLVDLWSLKLVNRNRINDIKIFYNIVPDVIPFLSRPSFGGRGGRHCDIRVVCAILKAARRLVAQGVWPSIDPVADYAEVPRTSVLRWASRLKRAGLWPDTTGLDRYAAQAAVQRIVRINKLKKLCEDKLAVPEVAPWGRPRRGRVSGIGGRS